MNPPMPNKPVLPWSYSSFDAYNTCPRRFYETRIAKNFVEEESEQMRWGTLVHEALEHRVRDSTPLPHGMAKFEPYALAVASSPGEIYCEVKLAVDQTLGPAEFGADTAWCRGVEDFLVINGSKAVSGDWKTGKVKPASKQLELSALRVFANFPEVELVTTSFVWLAFGQVTKASYRRDQSSALWDGFIEGVDRMLWSEAHNVWPAKRSGLCKNWCPVVTCPHNGKYRR